MLRRRRGVEVEPKPTMDTRLIGELQGSVSALIPRCGAFIHAVLFGTGELRTMRDEIDIYGLVLAGYEGLKFDDDGMYTALVASELPLGRWDGVIKLETEIDRAVREIATVYGAQHAGFIALDEAAVRLDVEVKRDFGIQMPSTVSWSHGTYHTGA